MILASDVFSDVRSLLDDDNSGRYTEAKDLVPAFNKAVLWIVAVFNAAFEQKKISPETLRELTTNKILAVTGTSTKKADLSTITNLWTILGVDPDPVVTGSPSVLSDTRNRWATRMTLEQWNDALADPFSASTGIALPGSLSRTGYIGPGDFLGDSKPYIMIRPGSLFTANNVCLWYLKNPTKATTGASQVEFPRSIYSILVDKTLNILSYQHGTGPGGAAGQGHSYGTITEKEIMQLISLIMS
jgi:hypothetical protein